MPMAKKLDTSWFNLKNYDKLSTLDLSGWYRQISMRNYLHFLVDNKKSLRGMFRGDPGPMRCLIELPPWYEDIKTNPIFANPPHDWGAWRECHLKHTFNTLSVMGTTPFQFWLGVNEDRLRSSDVWKYCELEHANDATPEQVALINTPINSLLNEIDSDGVDPAFVTIDLTATDEQIMSDFRHWLTEYRKAIGYESHKKNFTDKNLSEWVEWRLLPYIDLMLVAKVEKKEITQNKAARLIFSDEYEVDIVDRLRRTTKPKAEWLMSKKTQQAIKIQLHATA
jgi:hypothetical protein